MGVRTDLQPDRSEGTKLIRKLSNQERGATSKGELMRARLGVIVLLAAFCLGSVIPAYAGGSRRGHGYRGYGHSSYGYRGYYRRPSVVIVPRVVVPFRPYWPVYTYPPVVVSPPPVYVQPAPPIALGPPPPQYWYYCDGAQAYYPYTTQCPGGWRQVLPTPTP